MQANVFAFGIGSGIKYDELNSIASKPENVGQMQNFDQIEDFLRIVFLITGKSLFDYSGYAKNLQKDNLCCDKMVANQRQAISIHTGQ